MLSFSPKNIDACRRPLRATATAAPLAGTAALLALAGALCAPAALAAISDTVHPFVAANYTHDNNLLRLGDGQQSADGQRGDSFRQLQAGLLFERPIGRQVLTGHAKWSSVTFDEFDQFNYSGKDFLAALEWHLAYHLDGNLGASYNQSLTPFTDSPTSERNLRVQRREYVNGGWRFHPSWRLRSGFTRDRFDYDLTSQRFNERSEEAIELGLDYEPASGSRVGLQLRQVRGMYPNRRSVGAQQIDLGYDQNEVKANIYWRFSGTTQFQVLAGWVERQHNFFTMRDSSGLNGRAVMYWSPTGKLRLTATAWREYSAVESTLIESSLNNGASLAAAWSVSSKVRLDASVRREKRDFAALNGVNLTEDAHDSTRSASLGASYTPHPRIQLGVTLSREARDGSRVVGTGSYHANVASFNASAQF